MKSKNSIQSFGDFKESLNISDVSDNDLFIAEYRGEKIKFLLNENIKRSVTDLIIDELNRWENEYGIKTCDVNTGDCFVFAEKMEGILKMNGYKDVEVLTTDLFYDLATEDAKHDEEIFYNEQDYNSFKPLGFEWIKNGYHGWIYVNGKHYDAEEVNGVENFYDLPIFHRHIKRDR